MNIRLMEIEEPKFPYRFRTSADAYKAVKDYGKADRECFLVLFVNSKNQMLDCEVISVGTIDTAAVPAREVLKSALLNNATGIILAHNHPSGDCTPSKADLDITREIMSACLILQVHMLDHIIMGRDSYLSMVDSGIIGDMTDKITKAIKRLIGGNHA